MPTESKRPRYGIHGDKKFTFFEWVKHNRTHGHASQPSDDKISDPYEVCYDRTDYSVSALYFVCDDVHVWAESNVVGAEDLRIAYVYVLGGHAKTALGRLVDVGGATFYYRHVDPTRKQRFMFRRK